MDELISRITAAVGIDEGMAQTAVGVILGFLNKEGPSDAVGQLMGAIPGAEDLIAQAAGGAEEAGGGGVMGALGGLMGGGAGGGLGGLAGAAAGMMGGSGGLMGAASQLMNSGLDMDQIQGVTQEVVGFAREKAGDDVVGQIVANIPGMERFS